MPLGRAKRNEAWYLAETAARANQGAEAAQKSRPDNQSGGKEESGARLNLAERKKKQRTEWHWG